MSLKIGALFAGYGGLDLAVSSVVDAHPAWFSEIEKAPSAILAHHWPDVPNLGDVTKIDWAAAEPVDIITGGSPCQDLSHAGKRAGMKAGTRSGLWASMCDAIDIIRPSLVVWENVRGALSAEATSAVEPCPLCVGDGTGTTLRALGRVLGDLAELGYDSWWYGLRAADVGAAHGRFRVFVFATPADADHAGWVQHGRGVAVRAEQPAAQRAGDDAACGHCGHAWTDHRGKRNDYFCRFYVGTYERCHCDAHEGDELTLLPTPAVNDMGAAYTPATWDAWTAKMQAAHGNGNGHGKSLAIEAQRLLPTPSSQEPGYTGPLVDRDGDPVTDVMQRCYDPVTGRLVQTGLVQFVQHTQDWREYEAAIRRQEHAFGRPAPLPTEPGKNGQPRLSPRFVEWLMNLPDGWVTDQAIGISRNDQLKALGNGVVPTQAAAAMRAFLNDISKENAA